MEKRIFLPMTFWFSLPWIAYTYENIALHKLAEQRHPFVPSGLSYIFFDFSASNAVDGLKTDCSAYGGQCTLSAVNKREALWLVDLGSILSIHHITIYYRTDNVTWGPSNGFVHRFLGFSVYISNTTERKDFVLCFKDTTFNDTTIPAVLTLNCTTQGRYVAYYNNRTATNLPSFYSEYAFSELCEFEVYGCSNPGYYSENCSMPCPPHCVNSRCHIETGHCFECEDGYQGPMCEQLCQNNTFGGGCSENCGHCLSGLQCHHVTGSCNLGCAPGYYGSQCKTACPSGNNRSNGNCIQEDSSEENEEIGSNNQTGNMIIYVAIGGSVGVVTVVITVTVIVYKPRFININCRFPGSTHDAYVFQHSSIPGIFETLPGGGWLLGDSGYPLKDYLMTPFINPSTPAEERYNAAHCKTRNVVERAFGVLKARFRCLHSSGGYLPFKPEKCALVVETCMKLHNKAINERVPLRNGGAVANQLNNAVYQGAAPLRARELRQQLASRF